jgi:hypothetical protein
VDTVQATSAQAVTDSAVAEPGASELGEGQLAVLRFGYLGDPSLTGRPAGRVA